MRHDAPIWLFDSVCVLCDVSIWFTLRHGRGDTMRFLSIESDLGRALGFPVAGNRVPIRITVDRDCRAEPPGLPQEIWTRNFAGRRLSSTLRCYPDETYSKTFGPVAFTIGVAADDAGPALLGDGVGAREPRVRLLRRPGSA